MHLVLSRTDNLGDVMLTLPLAVQFKKIYPQSKVSFIGKSYTQPLIGACAAVDTFIDREMLLQNPAYLQLIGADALVFVFPDQELAKAVQPYVSLRIGTNRRWFHWLYCNQLVNLSRKNSNLHELDLNLALLQPLCGKLPLLVENTPNFQPTEDLYQLKIDQNQYSYLQHWLQPQCFHLVIHAKSKGSGREWNSQQYGELAKRLAAKSVQILLTGTAAEGNLLREQCPDLFDLPHVTDLTGKLNLYELVALLHKADGLLAAGTGPLHIAAALGIHVLGLYPPMRPIHPQRWKPIGKKAAYLTAKPACEACRKKLPCLCMAAITVKQVQEVIESWLQN